MCAVMFPGLNVHVHLPLLFVSTSVYQLSEGNCESDVLEFLIPVIRLLSSIYFFHQRNLIFFSSGIQEQLMDVNTNICHTLALQDPQDIVIQGACIRPALSTH